MTLQSAGPGPSQRPDLVSFYKASANENVFVTWQKSFSLWSMSYLVFCPGTKSPCGHTDSPIGKSWERAVWTKQGSPSRISLFFALIEGHAVARWPFYHHWFYRKKSCGGSCMGSPSWSWNPALAQWSWGLPETPLSVHHPMASPASCSLLQG